MDTGADLEKCFKQRVPVLTQIAKELEKEIRECLQGFEHVDSITSRVKSVSSFMQKASRISDGKPKYTNPLNEIQDQIGCRVVVFFKSDLEKAEQLVLDNGFHRVEIDRKQPETLKSFEYEAMHYICYIPHHIRDRFDSPIQFFELQIKTLFQHACAQAYHDIGYKAKTPITDDDDRLMHFVFAAAWGADDIFDKMNAKYNPN